MVEKKKKILIDLDVVTVAKWDKGRNGDVGRALIKKVENGKFHMVTPFYLLEHLMKWKHQWLKDEIEDFYVKEGDTLLTNEDVDAKIDNQGINDEEILFELQSHDIKEEDAFIVLVASIFDLDFLITFNRKHLKNKKKIINDILKKNGLRTINIIGPADV